MARDWVCPACGTRDPYTYPHHIVCRLCAHVAPRGAEPEHPRGLEPATFRRWGDVAILEGYRDSGGAAYLSVRELERAGFVLDPVLELVFHSEGYVVARPDDVEELFRVSEGAGLLPYDGPRAAEQGVLVLAALERALELLEGRPGDTAEPRYAPEIERLRRIVRAAHGAA
jgi:hypothetical protein